MAKPKLILLWSGYEPTNAVNFTIYLTTAPYELETYQFSRFVNQKETYRDCTLTVRFTALCA